MSSKNELEKLIEVIHRLRDPEKGCPWDIKQTHQSLLKYLIEEAYEFIHAAESKDTEGMEEELGDLLLQILLHARLAEEAKTFTLESVAKKLRDKLVYRHPHVFGNDTHLKLSSEQVLDRWQDLKVKSKTPEKSALMDESFLRFPALYAADKIGKRTNKIRFDWKDAAEVMGIVEGELVELKQEIFSKETKNHHHIGEEMGDLLFSVAQLARHLDINPEDALRDANRKFIRRFTEMTAIMKKENVDIEKLTQKEMDIFWNLSLIHI